MPPFLKNKNKNAPAAAATASYPDPSPGKIKITKSNKSNTGDTTTAPPDVHKKISKFRTAGWIIARSLKSIPKAPAAQATSPEMTTTMPDAPPAPVTPSAYAVPRATADDNASLTKDVADYEVALQKLQREEAALAFDDVCRQNATPAEQRANDVLLQLKVRDQARVFDQAPPHRGYGNQMHPKFAGDHYLSNVPLIQQTDVLAAAQHMPKGAHLHIHFNACLAPRVLLEIASRMDRMFITSDLPLVVLPDAQDPLQNFFLCEIQFSILAVGKENPGNLLAADYVPRQTMPFSTFLNKFPTKDVGRPAMDWLVSKLEFHEHETYDIPQTASGLWARFNGRTRMMKGLFGYVTAYKTYTQLFLQSLLDDNIQYAEIRPNFMTTNQLWKDDGSGQLSNVDIVELIKDECEKFKKNNKDKNFDGIKIIYCTPRSFPREKVRAALKECLAFKQRWPEYIAGFDLVGEEAQGHPLRTFVPELLEFRQACKEAGVEIPFLFHCGETLDKGTAVDGNLYDALLLYSKRIGHGFALPNHPHVMQQMKDKNICVEVCPISNEILGLTPRIAGHAVYTLLANNVPCTVASDNGTLFRSTLSHDFYQVLVGRADMGLYGWRRLAEWSLEHACFAGPQRDEARARWLDAWRDYVVWLLQTYDADRPETQAMLAQIAADKTLAAKALPKVVAFSSPKI